MKSLFYRHHLVGFELTDRDSRGGSSNAASYSRRCCIGHRRGRHMQYWCEFAVTFGRICTVIILWPTFSEGSEYDPAIIFMAPLSSVTFIWVIPSGGVGDLLHF